MISLNKVLFEWGGVPTASQMDRAIPEFNRVLHKKWQDQSKRAHRIRIMETNPRVDNALPSSFRYPILKNKKEQLLEDRCTEIERANRILLERMTNIMTQQPTIPVPSRKIQSNPMTASSAADNGRARSLNRGFRQKEIDRIATENETMLKRLQDKQSHYNVFTWEVDRKKQIKMVKKICYYPPALLKKGKNTKRRFIQKDPNSEVYSFYQQNLQMSQGQLDASQINESQLNNIQALRDDLQVRPNISNMTELPPYDNIGTVLPGINEANEDDRDYTLDNALRSPLVENIPGQRQATTQGPTGFGPLNSSMQQVSNVHSSFTNHSNRQPQTSAQQQPNNINLIASKRPPPMQVGYNEEGIEPNRRVLYRNFHDIEGVIYLVEISRNQKKVFILLFPNFEIPDIYLSCVMTEKQAQLLMSQNNNMFEEFVAKFYVRFSKLQIDGFHNKGPTIHQSNFGAAGARNYKSVSPSKKRPNLFNVHPTVRNVGQSTKFSAFQKKMQEERRASAQYQVPHQDPTLEENDDYTEQSRERFEKLAHESQKLLIEKANSEKLLADQAAAEDQRAVSITDQQQYQKETGSDHQETSRNVFDGNEAEPLTQRIENKTEIVQSPKIINTQGYLLPEDSSQDTVRNHEIKKTDTDYEQDPDFLTA